MLNHWMMTIHKLYNRVLGKGASQNITGGFWGEREGTPIIIFYEHYLRQIGEWKSLDYIIRLLDYIFIIS